MDELFHTLIEVVDSNSEKISNYDYIKICDLIKKIREAAMNNTITTTNTHEENNRASYVDAFEQMWQPVFE